MSSSRGRRKLYVIIAIAALIVGAGYVMYRVKKKDFLKNDLKQLVKEKTNQLYNISYDSIWVNEAEGDLYIRNLRVKGDTAVQLQMIHNGDTNAAKAIFDIYVPTLHVEDFTTARALISKQLICRQVTILNPKVYVYLFPGVEKPGDLKKQQQELYKQILGNLKLIKADSVSVTGGEVLAADFYTKEAKCHVWNTSIGLTDVAIDSTYNQDTTRTLFCKEIKITSDKIILGDKKSTAEVTNATFDTRSKIVSLAKFEYDAFKQNGSFKSEIEGISLKGFSWTGPMENSDVTIAEAIVDKGQLETLETSSGKKETGKKAKPVLNGWIQKFSLGLLKIQSVTYVSRPIDTKKKKSTVTNNQFVVKNINLDRTAVFDETLLRKAKEIEVNNDEISLKSSDNLYEFKVSGIKLNSVSKSLYIKSFKVIPQLNEAAFAKKAHYQTDRLSADVNDVRCSNVNIEKLAKGEIDIDNITTENNSVRLFRDLSYPVDSISRQGQQQTYPHQLIHKLSFPINIKRFTTKNTYIEYKEKNKDSKSSGRVRFSNSNITIQNISNHKPAPKEKTIARFTTSFIDRVPLTGAFIFDLDEWAKGTFTTQATISKSIDATILNELIEPMALMRIEKGMIHSLRFYMEADTNTSRATLQLPYTNLKISLLRANGKKEFNKKGVLSFFTNIVVRNNNKEDGMRTAKIELNRNKYRSFFNFIWSSVLKGIKDVCIFKI